jgi:hypothetical protein
LNFPTLNLNLTFQYQSSASADGPQFIIYNLIFE